MEVRPLEAWEELRACEELQREIWGEGFNEVAPAGLMKVTRRVGGVASGAFDEEGRLAGFVYGLTGIGEEGRPVHWSHMLGVRPGLRDRGLGLRLKEHQRRLLLERGVEEARWTFDPLVARNAHFNLNHLGVRVLDYESDMYGTSESDLHRGLGTDRFVVAWDLEDYDPEEARSGRRAEVEGAGGGSGPGDGDGPVAGAPEAGSDEPPGAAPPVVRVEIPADVFAVRERDAEAAADWRRRTRGAFLSRLEAGYRVAGFVPGPERGFYVLLHPEVGPDPEDRDAGGAAGVRRGPGAREGPEPGGGTDADG